jgi:hypothetical protein
MHAGAEEITESGHAAVRLLLAADRDRLAFGRYQSAIRSRDPAAAEAAREQALATPGEIAVQLKLLEERLSQLQTTPSLDLDRRLALALTIAAREAVLRLQSEFSSQA